MIDEIGNRLVSSVVVPPPVRNCDRASACHSNDVFDPGRSTDQQIVVVPGVGDAIRSSSIDERIIVIIVGIEDSDIPLSINAIDDSITIVRHEGT